MNKLKKLLLITLISSMAIFSSCGDDDDEVTGVLPCLQCTFPEDGDNAFFGAILNATWTNKCVGDIAMIPTETPTVDANGENILDEFGDIVYEMEEITYAADLIGIEKLLYEDEELFGATCTLVDKD